MTRVWDCLTHTWRTVYTRAEVLGHGWSWHAGTAAIVATLNCAGPPALAFPPPPVAHTPPAYEQPTPPWYPPAYAGLPPEMLLPPVGLPIPWGDVGGPFDVPHSVMGIPIAAEHEREHGKHHRHWWDCLTPGGPPTEVPEPSALLVLAVGVVGIAATRLRKGLRHGR